MMTSTLAASLTSFVVLIEYKLGIWRKPVEISLSDARRESCMRLQRAPRHLGRGLQMGSACTERTNWRMHTKRCRDPVKLGQTLVIQETRR